MTNKNEETIMHKDNHVERNVEKKDHPSAAMTLPLLGEAIARLQQILAAAPSSTIHRFLGQPFSREGPISALH